MEFYTSMVRTMSDWSQGARAKSPIESLPWRMTRIVANGIPEFRQSGAEVGASSGGDGLAGTLTETLQNTQHGIEVVTLFA